MELFVDGLCGQQDISRDVGTSTENGVTFSHVPKVRHELPHGRIVDGDVLDIDCGQGEARSVEKGRGISRVWIS